MVSSGGDHHPQVPRIRPAAAAAAWSAINVSLSALFYLFDFGTNVLTLHTYYYYSLGCHEDDSSKCDFKYEDGHSLRTVFFGCLGLMAGAHLSNSLIFWRTLDPSQHPLRLAYFLPLIHLSRLLKVLWCTCSFNSLEDLQEKQKESSSLYNVLAASLETAPQLMLQFHVVMELGDEVYYEWPDSFYAETAVPAPKILILSLVASLVSGAYNGSVAVLSLLTERGIMSLQWKFCILVVAGLHTLAAIAARTLIVAALAQYVAPALVYLLIGVIVTWIFLALVLKKSPHYHIQYSGNKYHKWVHGVHSLTLAHVSMFIGPMYVIVKHFDRPTSFLIRGTILHIFVELLGLGAVLVTLGSNGNHHLGRYWPAWQTPCHYNYSHDLSKEDNIYLSCGVFVEAVCPLLSLLLISSLVFSVVVKRGNLNPSRDEDVVASDQMVASNITQMETIVPTDLDVASNIPMETIAPAVKSMHMPKKDEHESADLDIASNIQMETIAPEANLDVANNIQMETIGMSMPEKDENELEYLDVASNPQMETITPIGTSMSEIKVEFLSL